MLTLISFEEVIAAKRFLPDHYTQKDDYQLSSKSPFHSLNADIAIREM